MKGRRIKKRPVAVLICSIILIIVITIFIINTVKELNYRKTIEYKLINIGYSKEEITLLTDKTNEDFMNSLLEKEYDEMYLSIIKEKYFIKDKINDYINYYEDNINTKPSDIIAIINTNANKEHYSEIKNSDIDKDILMINNKYYKLPCIYRYV